MKILVFNSGSSSQKSCLYEIGETLPEDPPACLWEGKIEWSGDAASTVVKNAHGVVQQERVQVSSRAHAMEHLLATLQTSKTAGLDFTSGIDVVGHRIVHGGPHFEEPVLITPEVKSAIAGVSAFAPLHNQAELEGIEFVEKRLSAIP